MYEGGFQKNEAEVWHWARGQNSNYEYTNVTYAFICGIIVFSEFSKFLSHMYHIFLRKLKFHFQLFSNTVL